LRAYGLTDRFKLNVETNHATLAGHTMMHELDYAGAQDMLGSIDANTGDLMLGWDTDQFLTDNYIATEIMLMLLKYGGLEQGGVNFDAKVRRESFEPVDLFHAHVGSIDCFARGLEIAAAIRADGELQGFVDTRYDSWNTGVGAEIETGAQSFESLEAYMLEKGEVSDNQSGRQEMLENLINRYM
jgi:xylose isomerase